VVGSFIKRQRILDVPTLSYGLELQLSTPNVLQCASQRHGIRVSKYLDTASPHLRDYGRSIEVHDERRAWRHH